MNTVGGSGGGGGGVCMYIYIYIRPRFAVDCQVGVKIAVTGLVNGTIHKNLDDDDNMRLCSYNVTILYQFYNGKCTVT